MKLNPAEKFLGSGFYTGYSPFAPGTAASAAALLIYLIPGFEKLYILIPAIFLAFISGIYLGGRFEEFYGKKDPSQCTIDEVAGMWISLILVPRQPLYIILSFVLWRFFDIIKPFPVRNAEGLPGGVGIMLDDVIAAVYSLIAVHLIILFF